MSEKERQLVKDAILVMFDLLADDKVSDAIADFTWKLYNKLVNKGFSENAAIAIVTNAMKSANK